MERIVRNENGKSIEQVISYDEEGNKVVMTYTREVIKQKPIVPEIVIDSYAKYRLCVRRSQEEKQYAYGKGDKRYADALGELASKNREQYLKYQHKLEEELRNH